MSTWTAQTTTSGHPEAVLDVLTDPAACARWSPIDFRVAGMTAPRLRAGTRVRVTGRLVGREVGFDVRVHEAASERLSLEAVGPIALEVVYEVAPAPGGSQVAASVGVRRGRGLVGRLLERATGALLAAGALDVAVSRLAAEVNGTPRP